MSDEQFDRLMDAQRRQLVLLSLIVQGLARRADPKRDELIACLERIATLPDVDDADPADWWKQGITLQL
jgi:hypothetical protein